MPNRTPKETLKAVRRVIEARRNRKNRVEVIKQPGPEEAPDTAVRCNG